MVYGSQIVRSRASRASTCSQPRSSSGGRHVLCAPELADDGTPLCGCGGKAAQLTSHTASNPERDFWACRKKRDDPKRCKFFCWADEMRQRIDAAVATHPSSSGSAPPSTPSASASASGGRTLGSAHSARAPPSSSAPKRRRIPVEEDGGSPSEEIADFPPPPSAGKRRMIEEDEAYPSDPIRSPSPEAQAEPAEQGRKRFRFSQPPSSPAVELQGGWKVFGSQEPETPSKGKGKEKDGALPTPPASGKGKSQWEKIRDDPNNPYHARAAALASASATPTFSFPTFAAPSSSPTTTPASNPSDFLAHAQQLLDSQARLERQVKALTAGGSAKAKRIAQLEWENETLRKKMAVLETTVEGLRSLGR